MNKKLLMAVIWGGVALSIFAIVCFRYYRHEKWQSAELKKIESELTTLKSQETAVANRIQSELATLKSEETNSVYKKIRRGYPIRMLIVGDSIGQGAGASETDNGWPSLVMKHIKEKYGVEVECSNISMGGESSLAGYVRLLELGTTTYYDLVFICYGQNDKNEYFEIYYESIIRRAQEQFPGCSIICIQEHAQRSYNEKMTGILKIANYYRIPVVDTIQVFQDYPTGYDSLVIDGTHPNDMGHSIIANEIEKIIEEEVRTEVEGIEKKEQPKIRQTTYLNTAMWINKEAFERDGLKWTTTIDEDIKGNGIKNFLSDGSGVTMVVDLFDFPGENKLSVHNNDMEIAAREKYWKYSFKQRHIPIIDSNIIISKGEISIEFSTEEQSNSFNGCGFILGE